MLDDKLKKKTYFSVGGCSVVCLQICPDAAANREIHKPQIKHFQFYFINETLHFWSVAATQYTDPLRYNMIANWKWNKINFQFVPSQIDQKFYLFCSTEDHGVCV